MPIQRNLCGMSKPNLSAQLFDVAMLTNYIKIALRSLKRQKLFAIINIGGLALGIAAAFVLGLYVRQELTYERHFEDHDRIYRVATDFFDMGGFANSQQQLLDVLPLEAPVLEQSTRFRRGFQETPVIASEQTYEETHYFFVDSSFFQMFSYRFLAGAPEMVMQTPDEAVLSDRLAEKYFGDEQAVGQVILVGRDKDPYRVTGVVATPPGKSHLLADLWLPLEDQNPKSAWTNVTYYNYVKLSEHATQADLEQGLDSVLRNHAYPASGFSGSFEEWLDTPQSVTFWAQPLTDIYLHSEYNFEIAPGGNPTQVYILGLIGLLILLIAGMNYVNLTTARSSVRAKEVGVKKTIGAGQLALVRQFLTESVTFSLFAMLLAAAMAQGMLAAFTFITGETLVENIFTNFWYPIVLLGFSILVGLAAGGYPAFYLASFRPVKILKGEWTLSGNHRLRGALVVMQFSIAIVLVISSLIVYQQLDFLQHSDKGFEHEGVIVVKNAGALGPQKESFRQQLASLPQVERSSFARRIPTSSGVWMYTYQTPDMEESITIQTFPGDADYLSTLGMRLVAGRNFSADLASDSNAVILNESAVRALDLGEDPIGKIVNVEGNYSVIGVVSDFNFQSLRQQIEPVVLTYDASGNHLALKLSGQGIAAFMDQLPGIWQQFAPDMPLRYEFLDENFALLAAKERMLGKAVSFFTLLALLIAAMGLFGLAAFTAERRTKEIGVRKVLGASVPNLAALLSKDFVVLVAIAFLLAAPVAYYAMQRWLQSFAYRIDIPWWVFVTSGIAALLIALLTVSYQAIKAALADPVKSLRYE